MSCPSVSVIIPVFNNPTGLKRCLDALMVQTYPKESYEIVVVDNGSDESLDGLIEGYPNIILVKEAKPSSYAARNAGFFASRGKYIAFTDSDCIPDTKWLEEGVRMLEGSVKVSVVAGHIEATFKVANKPTSAELFEKIVTYDQKRNVNQGNFAATSNLFTKREVFGKVGLFDGTLKSSGDVKWGNAVFRAGYRIIYAQKAIIFHPTRARLSELIQRHRRFAGGFIDSRKQGKVYTFVQLLRDTFRFLPTWKGLTSRLRAAKGLKVSRFKMVSLFFVLLMVRSFSAYERLRVWAGGESRRS